MLQKTYFPQRRREKQLSIHFHYVFRIRGFSPATGPQETPSGRGWRAHCDAALNPVGAVDHAGKLFERPEAGQLAARDLFYRSLCSRCAPALSEFLPAPRQPSGSGGFPHRWAGFFCYFSLPAKEK